MQSKFFTLAISVLALSVIGSAADAQSPSPTPKVGYVRFWDMLPATNGSFQLLRGDKPDDPPVATAIAYRYSSYTELPIGKYQLSVARNGSKAPLKTFSVDLKTDTYFTVLISPQSIDMFDDTENPKRQSAVLTIRNFFPGTSVTASLGPKTVLQSLAYGQSYSITGISFMPISLTIRTKLPNGKPAESTAEVDFKTSKNATALVIPDPYGRFRLRITPDGKNP